MGINRPIDHFMVILDLRKSLNYNTLFFPNNLITIRKLTLLFCFNYSYMPKYWCKMFSNNFVYILLL